MSAANFPLVTVFKNRCEGSQAIGFEYVQEFECEVRHYGLLVPIRRNFIALA